jgi:CheY-like chemotaxis protein
VSSILIVDDVPDILFMVRLNLELAGHQVTPAVTGEEAVEIMKTATPELILLDIRLPGMDGWEVLETLRDMGKLEGSAVIMLSAHATPSTADKAFELGCKGYITKPFSPDQLVEEVERVIAAG